MPGQHAGQQGNQGILRSKPWQHAGANPPPCNQMFKALLLENDAAGFFCRLSCRRADAAQRLPATVMPFVLHGVTLAGIDGVMAPRALPVPEPMP